MSWGTDPGHRACFEVSTRIPISLESALRAVESGASGRLKNRRDGCLSPPSPPIHFVVEAAWDRRTHGVKSPPRVSYGA